MSEGPKEARPRVAYRILAICYAVYGVVGGGLCLVMAAIGSQAARDSTQLVELMTAALLQPVPMFAAALATGFGGRRARLTAACVAVVLPMLGLGINVRVEHFWDFFHLFQVMAQALDAKYAEVEHFWDFFWHGQIWNLPGAAILVIVTVGRSLRD